MSKVRSRRSARARGRVSPEPRPVRGNKVALVALATTLVLAAVLPGAFGPDIDPAATNEIRGSWVTDAPTYAERGFDITGDSIRLYQGGGIRVRYPIRAIERIERDDRIEYTVTYESIVQEFDFRFDYIPADQPIIRLPRQPQVVWTRSGP